VPSTSKERFRIQLLVLLRAFRVLAVPLSLVRVVLVALRVALVLEVGLAPVADSALRLLLVVGLAAVLSWFPFQSVFVLVLLEIRWVEWES